MRTRTVKTTLAAVFLFVLLCSVVGDLFAGTSSDILPGNGELYAIARGFLHLSAALVFGFLYMVICGPLLKIGEYMGRAAAQIVAGSRNQD